MKSDGSHTAERAKRDGEWKTRVTFIKSGGGLVWHSALVMPLELGERKSGSSELYEWGEDVAERSGPSQA